MYSDDWGEDGRRKVAQLIKSIYESEEWPKYFTEVAVITLKKKPKATKFSDNHTVNLITHTAKRVAMILRRRVARKIGNVLGEDSLDLEEEKEPGIQLGCQE